MAGFQVANFDFGQNIEKNRIAREQIAAQRAAASRSADLQMRGQDIQKENADADRALRQQQTDEAARQFDAQQADRAAARDEASRQFDAQQAQREKALAADEKQRAWNRGITERAKAMAEDINRQKIEESDLRMQKFMKEMDAYDIAAENERMKSEEMIAQANERKKLLNGALGQGILAAMKGDGNLYGESLAHFNETVQNVMPGSPSYDFFGTNYVDPNTGARYKIPPQNQGEDENTLYMGSFVKEKDGKTIKYGNDGTPQVVIQAIPRGIVETVRNSAYGKAYLDGGYSRSRSGGGASGMNGLTYEQRLQLKKTGVDKSWDNSLYQALTTRINDLKYEKDYDEQGNYTYITSKPKKLDDSTAKLVSRLEARRDAMLDPGADKGDDEENPSVSEEELLQAAIAEKKRREKERAAAAK